MDIRNIGRFIKVDKDGNLGKYNATEHQEYKKYIRSYCKLCYDLSNHMYKDYSNIKYESKIKYK